MPGGSEPPQGEHEVLSPPFQQPAEHTIVQHSTGCSSQKPKPQGPSATAYQACQPLNTHMRSSKRSICRRCSPPHLCSRWRGCGRGGRWLAWTGSHQAQAGAGAGASLATTSAANANPPRQAATLAGLRSDRRSILCVVKQWQGRHAAAHQHVTLSPRPRPHRPDRPTNSWYVWIGHERQVDCAVALAAVL